MGLDWNPGNRPKAGHEAEFEKLFWRLTSGRCRGREKSVRRFHEISVSPFDTLCAPRVGSDVRATRWAKAEYARLQPDVSEEQWLAGLNGFYVLTLVAPCDGLPRYSNGRPGGYVEPFSFRAQFLRHCLDVIGTELFDQAYEPMLSRELLA